MTVYRLCPKYLLYLPRRRTKWYEKNFRNSFTLKVAKIQASILRNPFFVEFDIFCPLTSCDEHIIHSYSFSIVTLV